MEDAALGEDGDRLFQRPGMDAGEDLVENPADIRVAEARPGDLGQGGGTVVGEKDTQVSGLEDSGRDFPGPRVV